ncbi:hypothetical protein SELMODRAFT_410480 [Selaginella moellendorffii]|uniref:CBF1-interacting co-repressor CIR N-terminal domain-containing protein n=1 Tax=Selaginella moellendorffii TaxID=88036 RepID=D8REW1_SELML|nr:hypothetical protein SELMODRAFT_410480 [Selaginella moellendorffii]
MMMQMVRVMKSVKEAAGIWNRPRCRSMVSPWLRNKVPTWAKTLLKMRSFSLTTAALFRNLLAINRSKLRLFFWTYVNSLLLGRFRMCGNCASLSLSSYSFSSSSGTLTFHFLVESKMEAKEETKRLKAQVKAEEKQKRKALKKKMKENGEAAKPEAKRADRSRRAAKEDDDGNKRASDEDERYSRRKRSAEDSDEEDRHRNKIGASSRDDREDRSKRIPERDEQDRYRSNQVREDDDTRSRKRERHDSPDVDDRHRRHEDRHRDREENRESGKPPLPRKKVQLSEEEKMARLRGMQQDAELHEEQRWQRIKRASASDAVQEEKDSIKSGKNFLDETNRGVYGTENGGSASVADTLHRRSHYREKFTDKNAFRRS